MTSDIETKNDRFGVIGFALIRCTSRIGADCTGRCRTRKPKQYKRYSSEFKREALRRATEQPVQHAKWLHCPRNGRCRVSLPVAAINKSGHSSKAQRTATQSSCSVSVLFWVDLTPPFRWKVRLEVFIWLLLRCRIFSCKWFDLHFHSRPQSSRRIGYDRPRCKALRFRIHVC